MPLLMILIWIILLVIVWAIFAGHAEDKRKEKQWILLNRILLAAALAAILFLTLLTREVGERTAGGLFGKMRALSVQKEYVREMLMNVFLFVPFGLCMPFGIKKPGRDIEKGKPELITVMAGLLISALIELMQLIFKIGVPEIEDILCNTVGALIGTGAFVLWMKSREIRNLFLSR